MCLGGTICARVLMCVLRLFCMCFGATLCGRMLLYSLEVAIIYALMLEFQISCWSVCFVLVYVLSC
jgi:hypothetical protein